MASFCVGAEDLIHELSLSQQVLLHNEPPSQAQVLINSSYVLFLSVILVTKENVDILYSLLYKFPYILDKPLTYRVNSNYRQIRAKN